jgi:hypothetical protein
MAYKKSRKGIGGRPTVMTEKALLKLNQAFAMGCSDKEACLYADVSTAALYEYQKQHPEFTERKALLKEKPILRARTTVIANLGDPEYATWYLERKLKGEFSTRKEVTGTDGEPMQVNIVKYEAKDVDVTK